MDKTPEVQRPKFITKSTVYGNRQPGAQIPHLKNLTNYESANAVEPQFFHLQNGNYYDYSKRSLSLLSARH